MASLNEEQSFETWTDEIVKNYSKANLSLRYSAPKEIEFKIEAEFAHSLLGDLQNRGFIHLSDLSAYDESPAEPRFHVFYQLLSLRDKKRVSVVAMIKDSKNPTIKTAVDLWAGANWLERETYDMYGIIFQGHPDMRRMLLPEAFKGHPLRKDFIVDYRQEFEKTLIDEGVFDPFGSTVVKSPRALEEV